MDATLDEFDQVIRSLAPRTEGLGLEQVMVQFKVASPDGGVRELMLRMSRPPGAGLTMRVTDPPGEPLRELNSYTQKVIRARRRGTVYPYELVPLITRSPDPGGAPGTFTEYDLDESGSPAPVDREPGRNTASLVLGVVSTPTTRYPEGMRRVVLMGDPTRALGALAEPECRRVLAALDLARRLHAPVEWFAISAGAMISMDSGTETMDWISRALRGIVEFTQDGGEINVVVTGINVGAQPYWNAEATMLMHTKGILVMTPDSAMVLTGKHSLDYSGGVSAEDNFGIGGYDRIMGPNGEAQYWAPDLSAAIDVLLAHYQHAYVAEGERFPRPAPTTDPDDRDISVSPHSGPATEFGALGEIFDAATNPERKKPFDIRSLLRGVADADHPTLERWADMADAESAVVLDAHLGGQPVTVIGFESRPLARRGLSPVDGPSQWTAGTLFPLSSKKTARAVNAASGNRPLVILANLSGFDGSPESLRRHQLEYGAEIGRAMVNFDGPIVFCVVSRYHGGAFVVFSGALNDTMEVAAVEGSYASVIGGAPAAAVVFAAEVNKRTSADPRVADLQARIAEATSGGDEDEASRLRGELASVWPAVHAEKLGQIADEFDRVHSIERAYQVGSVQAIVPPARLRSYLIDAVRRGDAAHAGRGREPGSRVNGEILSLWRSLPPDPLAAGSGNWDTGAETGTPDEPADHHRAARAAGQRLPEHDRRVHLVARHGQGTPQRGRLLDRVERFADHRVRRELRSRGSPRHSTWERQRRGEGHRDPPRCRPRLCWRAALEAPGPAQSQLRGHQEVHGPPGAASSVGGSRRRGARAAVDPDRRRRRGSRASPFGVPRRGVRLRGLRGPLDGHRRPDLLVLRPASRGGRSTLV